MVQFQNLSTWCDDDIGRLYVSVNDRGLERVQVLQNGTYIADVVQNIVTGDLFGRQQFLQRYAGNIFLDKYKLVVYGTASNDLRNALYAESA